MTKKQEKQLAFELVEEAINTMEYNPTSYDHGKGRTHTRKARYLINYLNQHGFHVSQIEKKGEKETK